MRRISISEKTESKLIIVRNSESIASDYIKLKILFGFSLVMLLINLFILLKDNENSLSNFLVLIMCTMLILFLGWGVYNKRNEVSDGYCICFDKEKNEIIFNKNTVCLLEKIRNICLHCRYSSHGRVLGYELIIKHGDDKLVLESLLQEEEDIEIGEVISEFTNKPLVYVR